MLNSYSQAPAFKRQIMELSRNGSGVGYYWRRKGEGHIQVFFDGHPFGSSTNTVQAILLVRDHAKRVGLWRDPDLLPHYFSYDSGVWRLYVKGRFSKKSPNKKELEDYVEIMSFLDFSGRGKQWGHKK
jgi:hypothetical protein